MIFDFRTLVPILQTMSIRTERLSAIIREIAGYELITLTSSQEHTFGIISILDVEISHDGSAAKIIVEGKWEKKELLNFLKPLISKIQSKIWRELKMRRNPKISFSLKKPGKNPADILSLINELDKKYGLSQ